jgi:hypothetical protein
LQGIGLASKHTALLPHDLDQQPGFETEDEGYSVCVASAAFQAAAWFAADLTAGDSIVGQLIVTQLDATTLHKITSFAAFVEPSFRLLLQSL